MKIFNVTPGNKLSGTIRVASDKSISHRAIMLASLCEGSTDITTPLISDDIQATINAMQSCGIAIREDSGSLHVKGGSLRPPETTIDCGNSGTLIRLFAGIASSFDIPCKLIGDSSLMQRPMKRITAPLQQMGAVIQAEKSKPPIIIGKRSEPLSSILYSNTLSSAQVKTAILFAGLNAEGSTIIAEPNPSRDHSERMLEVFGATVRQSEDKRIVEISRSKLVSPGTVSVPADISSAIFFMVGAAITPDSDILLTDVGINPTRTGGLDILMQMGADIDILNERFMGNEPVADIRVRGGELHGVTVGADLIPSSIDDIPALLIAAAAARGETRITGAEELRHKESDRISAVANGLQAIGVNCKELEDGIIVSGKNGGKPSFSGGEVESEGDHRIAMAFTMASLRAKNQITIKDCDNVATSFPNFVKLTSAAGLRVIEENTSD